MLLLKLLTIFFNIVWKLLVSIHNRVEYLGVTQSTLPLAEPEWVIPGVEQ